MSGEGQNSESRKQDTGTSLRKRWGKRFLFGIVLITIVTVGVAIVRSIPITRRYYTDADTIREPAATTRPRDILWQPPKPLAEIIDTAEDDYEPRLSADGLTLFFVRGKAGTNADIHFSRKTPEGWTEPEPLVGVNGDFDDLGPEPSPDGESLYFYSDRPGGSGGYDIWVSHRGRDGWQPPLNLGPAVNSEFNDYGPALTPDGTVLYFASNRPRPEERDETDPDAWPATVREDLYQRDYDLYMAAVTEAGFGQAEPLNALNTRHNEGAPAVSSFGDFLYFASDRPAGHGGFDLYRSRRVGGVHRPVKNLGEPVNTSSNELDPGLSLGGYALYFSSDTGSSPREPGGTRQYDLYYTTSREVFPDVERLERPPINWMALWEAIGPNLLWALLLLVVLLALLALMKGVEGRRLSLLAKCLLASLMAHLLLMILFNVWEVTASLAREFRRSGRIQVALASPSSGNDLARQIHGPLTQVEAPAPLPVAPQRQVVPVQIQSASAMAALTVERRPLDIPDEAAAAFAPSDAAIQHRTEPPPLPRPQSSVETPVPLDPNVPSDRDQIDESEADSPMGPEVVQAESLTRPPVFEATWQAPDAAQEVTPVPPTYDTSGQQTNEPTLAAASSSHDAELQPTAAPTPFERVATVDESTVPELTLPEMRESQLADAEMPAPRISAQASPAPRRDLAEPVTDGLSGPNLRHLAPQSGVARIPDATIVKEDVQRIAEAIPAPPSVDPQHGLPPGLASVAMPNVGLAPLETEEQDTVTESEPTALTASARPHRREFDPDESIVPAQTALTLVAPEALEDTLRAESLATRPDRYANDSSLEAVQQDSEDVSRAEVSIAASVEPVSFDVAVPAAEREAATAESYSATVSALEATADAARAEPTLDQGPQEDIAATFNVSPAWQHDADTPPSDLVEIAARDSELADTPEPTQLAMLPTLRDITIPETPNFDLDFPLEERPPTDLYAQRSSPDRMEIVERMGGSPETERAVADALRWLAGHQSPDGRWDGDGFDDRCGQCGGETSVVVDHALTGLALLSFLGAGHTHVTDGPYKDTVDRGLRWLRSRQNPNGDLRGDETMYTQGIASIALSEAYGMTKDSDLVNPVRLAAHFIDRARNRSVGGWRYDPGQVGDTSVLGWQIMALKSASVNGVAVPAESFAAASKWLDLVSDRSRPGLYAYQPRRQYTPAMTAEGMFTQQLLGRRPDDPRMEGSVAFISEYPPDWESGVNTYYWYYATLALFQHQGPAWVAWNEVLTEQLLANQRRDGEAAGSWDPDGEWADIGGRVYQTTLCTLMLEVYYRYLPLYSLDAVTDPIGAMRGVVTDAATGRPLDGATVRLDLPDRPAVSARSAFDGTYKLLTPEVPDFFALSASMEGFVPSTANVASAMVEGTTLAVNFELVPESETRVAIEPVPDVHHLGDNNFEGRINSQFQKESEGSAYAATFELQRSQLPPRFNSAEVHLLAKGVQRSHRIVINGTTLDERLDDAPDDGSFGEFVAPLDTSLLKEGTNLFEVIAKPSSTDIDDFEFVNVRIHLSP